MQQFIAKLHRLWQNIVQFDKKFKTEYALIHQCLLITAFTIGMVEVAQRIVFNTQILSPVAHALESFNMADNYYKVNWGVHEANNEKPAISENITIVDLAGATREQTARTLQLLDSMAPSAIGIDVIFHKDSVANTDTLHLLDSTIHKMPHLVLAARLEGACNDYKELIPIDAASPHSLLGYVNTEVKNGYVLNKVSVQRCMGDTIIKSLPALLVEHYRDKKFSEKGDTLDRRIEFPYVDFTVLKADTLSERSWGAVHNRIVLVGYMDDPSDFKITPIDDRMPGVKVWAYGINTLLDHTDEQNKHTEIPFWLLVIIIGVLTFLAALWHHGWDLLTDKLNKFIVIRYFGLSAIVCTIVMLIMAAIVALIFFIIFHKTGYFIPPAYALACIALEPEGHDLYKAIYEKKRESELQQQ